MYQTTKNNYPILENNFSRNQKKFAIQSNKIVIGNSEKGSKTYFNSWKQIDFCNQIAL